MKPVKIFELVGPKWMDGQSLRTSFATGGLFSSTASFDPFDVPGMMQCSLTAVTASSSAITATPTVIISWQDSGTAKIYAHTEDKLYEVLDGSPYTTVDKTAQITVHDSSSLGVRGAIVYKNRYIYALSNQIRSNVFPVASGSDVQILNGSSSDKVWHPFCIGADGNLYQADGNTLNKITNVTGTSSNSAGVISTESSMFIRHIVSDGRYLVLLADNNRSGDGNNPTTPVAGRYRCQVLFWDMVKGTFDQIYEFYDSYLIAGAFLDGGIYVFGGDNLYVCNIATPPKAIFSFKAGSTITEKPKTAFQVTQARHSIYWCGQTNGRVYAYGSLVPGMRKVFYQPFAINGTPSAIMHNGTNFYVGSSATDIFMQVTHTGTARDTGSVTTAPIVLPQAYRFDHIKVVMQQPLASGDSIDAYMTSMGTDGTITASGAKTFSTIGPKQSIIFDRKVSGVSDHEIFEDFQLTVASNKAVARVEVWATPIEPNSQTL